MSEQEMMETIARVSAPGKEHQLLKKMAGNWDVTLRTWMNPDEPPHEVKGTATIKMILGDRYLVEDFKTELMGQPYEGHGMMGFDSVEPGT